MLRADNGSFIIYLVLPFALNNKNHRGKFDVHSNKLALDKFVAQLIGVHEIHMALFSIFRPSL